jgi:hypothetical protein
MGNLTEPFGARPRPVTETNPAQQLGLHPTSAAQNASAGAYDWSYQLGYRDSTSGTSSDNPHDYYLATTPEGNRGYAQGYQDGLRDLQQ